MAENGENKVKIRFKFRSGEEFEAEGNLDFIEKQRANFLQLIGKDSPRAASSRTAVADTSTFAPENFTEASDKILPIQNIVEENTLDTSPAAYRRGNARDEYTVHPAHLATPPSEKQRAWGGEITRGISAAEARRLSAPQRAPSDAETRLWEQVARTDDRLVYLRRKSRLLSPDTAALVLLAAAKVLLQANDGYSALLLSKSLKKSGYGGERLDRVLAIACRQSLLLSQGTKRSRVYLLSNEGFAKAYVLAEKLAAEWR